jgi:predicted dehydrogenase
MSAPRVCVIGYGHLGRHHARICGEIPACELAGVADTDDAAREAASKLGVPVCENHNDFIGKADAAIVATPTASHLAVARDFIEAGVPVLIEKPLAKTLDEARELAALAASHGVPLQVGHVERFNPVVTAVAADIRSPRFIQADRVSPFSFRSIDVGVVMDLMIHDIDLILNLVRSPVVEVAALGVPVLGITEDIANARLVFAGGCVANVTASRVAVKTERKIRLFQEDAYISLDLAARSVQFFQKKGGFTPADLASVKAREVPNALFYMLEHCIDQRNVPIEDYDPLTREIESFLAAVKGDAEPVVTGEDGVEAIRVAEMVIKSLKHPPWEKE